MTRLSVVQSFQKDSLSLFCPLWLGGLIEFNWVGFLPDMISAELTQSMTRHVESSKMALLSWLIL